MNNAMNIKQIKDAIDALKNGKVILYPTDTVWGLGCDATNADAIDKIFRIKGRPENKGLIILVNSTKMICRYVREAPEVALQVAEISDKPLTIIYPDAINLPQNVVSEDGSIGIRVVRHPLCEALISGLGKPIVSTSANRSGERTPALFKDISPKIIGKADWVAEEALEEESTGKASSIISIGKDGAVKIIRNY